MENQATPETHADHEHSPHLAHHFDTPAQQFEAGGLGMWLFLATEILLFSGLFCAYAVYRGLHPEVFLRVDEYLDKYLGALNTVILLCSSFTMALAVWAAQHSRQRLLVWMLAATFVGACGFLAVKYIEYKHKWEHHLLWGAHFDPGEHAAVDAHEPPEPAAELVARAVKDIEDGWEYAPAASGPRGLLRGAHAEAERPAIPDERLITAQFFAIYFAMTGLHGIHVIAGMAVIAWLWVRAMKRHFNADYFTPVPLGGLYWHLVDLIWIYLFPLLYLIH